MANKIPSPPSQQREEISVCDRDLLRRSKSFEKNFICSRLASVSDCKFELYAPQPIIILTSPFAGKVFASKMKFFENKFLPSTERAGEAAARVLNKNQISSAKLFTTPSGNHFSPTKREQRDGAAQKGLLNICVPLVWNSADIDFCLSLDKSLAKASLHEKPRREEIFQAEAVFFMASW